MNFQKFLSLYLDNVSVSNDPEEELKGYDALAPWNGQNPDSSSKQIFAISPVWMTVGFYPVGILHSLTARMGIITVRVGRSDLM